VDRVAGLNPTENRRRVDILGLSVDIVDRPTLLARLRGWAGSSAPATRMYYTNAHVFNLAAADVRFREVLNSADVLICEGYGGRAAARVLGKRPLPVQFATMDWMDDLLVRLAADGRSIYLLGDEPGVAPACAAAMQSNHPGLRVTGSHDGFFLRGSAEEAEIISCINAGTDVLMVGMGNPLQEFWIEEHLQKLDVSLILSLGAMFRWYAAVEKRAPAWLRRLHLEWLARLLRHPKRHFKRYVVGNPALLWRAFRVRIDRAKAT